MQIFQLVPSPVYQSVHDKTVCLHGYKEHFHQNIHVSSNSYTCTVHVTVYISGERLDQLLWASRCRTSLVKAETRHTKYLSAPSQQQ